MSENLEKSKIFAEKSKKSKRLDLQGVRGIAIISVLAFHFLPKKFPNGYVGVDQFFVLSGFLMCMLLRHSKIQENSSFILNFYTRRLKRILPLYFLILFLGILAIFSIFPYTSVVQNIHDAKKALIFLSNQMESEEENYFSLLSMAIDIFTHTWSLSVEVQFYFLCPFIYILGSKISQKFSEFFEIFYYGIIGLLSFWYSKEMCTENEAFHSVWARVWQFSVGILAYLLSNSNSKNMKFSDYQLLSNFKHSETPNYSKNFALKIFKISLTIFTIFTAFFHSPISPENLRQFLTIFTGILIYLEISDDFLLESRILTYFGDISYSLYLIHWPIYAYWNLTYSHGDSWNRELILAMGLSILLAILSFEFFEKWYLSQSTKTIILLSSTLFLLNLGALFQKDVSNLIFPPEITQRLDGLKDGEHVSYVKAEQLNRAWAIEDLPNLRAPTCEYNENDKASNYGLGYCRHTGLNGTYKIVIIGNSWGANHARVLYQECGAKAKSLIQHTFPSHEPLYPWKRQRKQNLKAIKQLEKFVPQEQPDYLFIFSRAMDILDLFPPSVKNVTDDPIYKKMKSQLEIYSKPVKRKVFIMNQIPRIDDKKVGQIVKNVREGKHLIDFDKSLIARSADTARLRYEKLGEECSKCEIFDYKPYFFNETTGNWRLYDESQSGLTYITEGIHLSFHGLELIRPKIREICEKL